MNTPVLPSGVLISAHRGGPKSFVLAANSLASFSAAVEANVDLIEFDVHVCADGEFVVSHSATLHTPFTKMRIALHTFDELVATGAAVVKVEDVCDILAASQVVAHVDVKFVSKQSRPGCAEWELADVLLQRLGAGRFIFTSRSALTSRSLAAWCAANSLVNCVGLSLFLPLSPMAKWDLFHPTRMLPAARFRASNAGFVVVHKMLARAGVLAWAGHRGVKVLVWTCDSDRSLSAFLRDARVWAVTSNDPARALGLRTAMRAVV